MSIVKALEEASDEDLMGRVQSAGDVEAFGCLYDRYATAGYRVARTICGDSHRAEEAVQDGFLSIWRGRERFRPQAGSFRAWSLGIVRNAAIDTLRHEHAAKRPRVVQESAERADPHGGSLEEDVVARSDAETLRESLRQLPTAQAEVIGLAFFGKLTHAEIAVQLALPPGTVKGRMRLGLEKLRHDIAKKADGH